jgi:hypothetical protein
MFAPHILVHKGLNYEIAYTAAVGKIVFQKSNGSPYLSAKGWAVNWESNLEHLNDINNYAISWLNPNFNSQSTKDSIIDCTPKDRKVLSVYLKDKKVLLIANFDDKTVEYTTSLPNIAKKTYTASPYYVSKICI